jgi:rubrerythrin
MALDIFAERGVPLERQSFDWRDLVRTPISKLDDDAFTGVRVILMNGIEAEAVRFSHSFARMDAAHRRALAEVRRIEKHQQTLVGWLLPPDQSPLETTLGYEQVAIEITADVAEREPDEYLAQVYRFGMLEDFDHLYRFSALFDRLEGKDANNITQSYTDITPGRPTVDEHRAPVDDLRAGYDRHAAHPLSRMHALTILAAEQQVEQYYATVGPLFADPLARQLYAEIGSIEEQHVTQYECLADPTETWLEKWVLHEANEVYTYYACLESETNPRLRDIWQRFCDYELGHLAVARDLFERIERRDAAEILPRTLPEPLSFASHRAFVREVLRSETNLTSVGTAFRDASELSAESAAYRNRVNAHGSPSEIVAAGYRWAPGTELAADGRRARRTKEEEVSP